jgi:cell division transport system permease protein
MIFYTKRALKDILDNRFLNALTIITIALTVLIVSAFGLFFLNAQDMFNAWKRGVRVMVYLTADASENQRSETRQQIQNVDGIQHIRFISKAEAMELMQARMPRQSSVLMHLRENPLPDAFELTLVAESNSLDKVEFIAKKIEGLPSVSDVEYGQQWIDRFSSFFNLFKLAGTGMGVLFLMATVFIAANTIRLVLYSRQEEIRIMRLVGATDRFIKFPIYLEGLFQGLLGSLAGLGGLYAAFFAISSKFGQTLSVEMITVRFFPIATCTVIVVVGMLIGLLGAYFSMKQFMKA